MNFLVSFIFLFLPCIIHSQSVPFSINMDSLGWVRTKADSFVIYNYTDDTLKFDSISFAYDANRFASWGIYLVKEVRGGYFPRSVPFGDVNGCPHTPRKEILDSLLVFPRDSLIIHEVRIEGNLLCDEIENITPLFYPDDTLDIRVVFSKNGFDREVVFSGLYHWELVENTETSLSHAIICKMSITPNPFSPQTTITFSGTQNRESFKLNIIDPTGRVVRTMSGSANGGKVSYVWDGTDQNRKALARGIYVANVVGKGVNMKKLLVLTK